MTGAIEFLQKAKAICENEGDCSTCPMGVLCITDISILNDEADLIRKVMEYRLEDKDGR